MTKNTIRHIKKKKQLAYKALYLRCAFDRLNGQYCREFCTLRDVSAAIRFAKVIKWRYVKQSLQTHDFVVVVPVADVSEISKEDLALCGAAYPAFVQLEVSPRWSDEEKLLPRLIKRCIPSRKYDMTYGTVLHDHGTMFA